MVKLPNYVWFLGNIPFRGAGNVYSGSAGCDPMLGNISSKVFRYRVWIQKNDDGMRLIAGHYIGEYNYESTDSEIITEKVFDASPEGILEAESWIQDAQDNALAAF